MPRLIPRLGFAPPRLSPSALAIPARPASCVAGEASTSTSISASSSSRIQLFAPPSLPRLPRSPTPATRSTAAEIPAPLFSFLRPSSAPTTFSRFTAPSLPALSAGLSPALRTGLMQVRFSRGNSYQPHTLKRKRDHGFLSRIRTKKGRKILARRRQKGRRFLSH